MVPENAFYEKFIEIVKEKIPQRGKLTIELVDLLFIEKEAVYRRLRGEVPFTFSEIARISNDLGISLDSIIGSVVRQSDPYLLHIQNFLDLKEKDLIKSRDYVAAIQYAGRNPYSEFGFATSIIPLHFSVRYEAIYRLYLLKWMYQIGNPSAMVPFEKIFIPEILNGFHQQYLKEVQNIKYTYFIWDDLFLLYLINDIKYFNNIRLITKEDVHLLKEDLRLFLNNLEQLAFNGAYDTGNKVSIYVSSLNFTTSYSYFTTTDVYVSMINTFTVGEMTSIDKDACDRMKTWMQALKRTSTLISESAERDRILFFERQREVLNSI